MPSAWCGRSSSGSATSGLSFNGQRARSNNIMVDGLDNNDITTGSVGATFGPLDIAMGASGRDATVKFTAAVTGGSGVLLPSSGQVYDVTTGWRMDGDAWQLVTAEWNPKL